jgi:hypothetical protein
MVKRFLAVSCSNDLDSGSLMHLWRAITAGTTDGQPTRVDHHERAKPAKSSVIVNIKSAYGCAVLLTWVPVTTVLIHTPCHVLPHAYAAPGRCCHLNKHP